MLSSIPCILPSVCMASQTPITFILKMSTSMLVETSGYADYFQTH